MDSEPHVYSVPRLSPPRRASLVAAAALFIALFLLRLSVEDAEAPDLLYMLPVAIAAAAGGLVVGIAAASLAFALYLGWAAAEDVAVDELGLTSRAAAYYLLGGGVGYFAQRPREALARLRLLIESARRDHRA